MKNAVTLFLDTLVLEDNDSYIVYVPFSKKLTRTTKDPLSDKNLFDILSKNGFFNKLPHSTNIDSVDNWSGFKSLTLLVARKCNLACVYCYAAAKPNGESMPEQLALDALDWFNGQLKQNTIRITFHGGGEPTLEKNLIKKVVSRTKEIANGKNLRFHIVTNGTADSSFMDWLATENFGISISADGPPAIQNRNRPYASGLGSSKKVEETIRSLVAKNVSFTIRLTFSPTDNLSEIIGYFGNLGVKSLHLEPIFPHGRNYKEMKLVGNGPETSIVDSASSKSFADKFLEALDIARNLNIRITNSHLGNLSRGNGYFCGSASGRSMIVTHDGLISGCLEVVDKNDPDLNHFNLGKYDSVDRDFKILKPKLIGFQSRHADSLKSCKDCYARYTCAGGCAVKAVRATGDFAERDESYCSFTKMVIPAVIKRIAEFNGV